MACVSVANSRPEGVRSTRAVSVVHHSCNSAHFEGRFALVASFGGTGSAIAAAASTLATGPMDVDGDAIAGPCTCASEDCDAGAPAVAQPTSNNNVDSGNRDVIAGEDRPGLLNFQDHRPILSASKRKLSRI
jgi:hypothetical protein